MQTNLGQMHEDEESKKHITREDGEQWGQQQGTTSGGFFKINRHSCSEQNNSTQHNR